MHSRIKNWNPVGWATDHPRRATALAVIVALWVWTGQTYVWNPFFFFGYQYYPFLIFISAGVLGQLLPHRKRTKKQDLEHAIHELNAVTGREWQPKPDPTPPPPLESLRDDDEA